MPFRQLGDAGAQSTCASPITNSQTSVTLQSTTGFPALLTSGQLSVIILDSGNLAFSSASPLSTNYEYQPVNAIAGNVLTFGLGGGAASRAAYAGTTPKSYSAGATIAVVMLAEDIVASAPWKFDEQIVSGVSSIRIPAAGSFPTSYLGVNFRHIEIVYRLRDLGAGVGVGQLRMQWNGDTTASYFWGNLFNNPPASVGYNEQFGDTSALMGMVVQGGSAPSGENAQGTIRIEYAFDPEIKHAEGRANGTYGIGTPGIQFAIRHGHWNNTAATQSLTLFETTPSQTISGVVTTYLIP